MESPDQLQRRRARAEKANKARAKTRAEFKALLHELDRVLGALGGADTPMVTCAGRRAVGKDGRSVQHILDDAVRYMRGLRAERHMSVTRSMPPPPPRLPPVPHWPSLHGAIDDYTMREGLLSSQTVACFVFEMPGWTLQALSPGARHVLGHSPFGSCEGQELLNGFVHWKDVDLVEGMWVSALATGSATSSRVRILQSRRRTLRRGPQPGAGRADHEAPVGGSSNGMGDRNSVEFSEEGIYPLLPPDAMVEGNDDLWLLPDSPADTLDKYFASDCVTSAGGSCAAPGTRQEDLDSSTTGERVGCSSPEQCSTVHRFEHRFVSLHAEISCLPKHGQGRKQVGMLLAPLDTASLYILGLGEGEGEAAGCERTGGVALATCSREQARDRQTLVWEDSEEDSEKLRQDELTTLEALGGVYKFDWEHSVSHGLTPGDLRQFLYDLSAAIRLGQVSEGGARDLQCSESLLDSSALESSSDSAKKTGSVRCEAEPVSSGGVAVEKPSGTWASIRASQAFRNFIGLHQSIAQATGAVTTWTVKTAVNMILRYSELHFSCDKEEDVLCITGHARAHIFGLSGPWVPVMRFRIDGDTVYALPNGLGVMHSQVKSCAGSFAFASFWVHDRPYQELCIASREACKEPYFKMGRRASATPARVAGSDGPLLNAWMSLETSESTYFIPEHEGLHQTYVQHTRTMQFDKCTQTCWVHGFLPGKGEYCFNVRKIAPADDTLPRGEAGLAGGCSGDVAHGYG